MSEPAELPFVDLPADSPKVSRFRYVRDSVKTLADAAKAHGGLIRIPDAARILKVSNQRVRNLIADGKIRTIDLRDSEGEVILSGVIPVDSVKEWARQSMHSKPGRPPKKRTE